MLVEFIDAIEENKISVNKNKVIAVRPREKVALYELENVTEIEFDTVKVYVKESYEQVIDKLNK